MKYVVQNAPSCRGVNWPMPTLQRHPNAMNAAKAANIRASKVLTPLRLALRSPMMIDPPMPTTKTPGQTTRADGGATFSIGLHAARRRMPHDRYAPGLHHLAFHAGSRGEVDAVHELVRSTGAAVLDPPAEYDYTPGYYAVFFADPDGLKLEVVFEPRLAHNPG